MPGIRHSVGGVIRTVDDRRRIILLGETAGDSTVFGVWGGDDDGVVVVPPTYEAREDNRRETALGYHVPWWRATHL